MLDFSALDRVMKETLAALEKAKSQVFDIAEATQRECTRLQLELDQVVEELKEVIAQVDELEVREKRPGCTSWR